MQIRFRLWNSTFLFNFFILIMVFFLLNLTKKVISVITIVHKIIANLITHIPKILYCNFIIYYVFKSSHKISLTWEIHIFPLNGVSHKWIVHFEYKDKAKGMRRPNLQPPSLLHQFVSCRFYYYYCQMAIRRSNLHAISWFCNVPEDKRLMDGAVFMTYADRQEIAAQSKTPWKAHSQGWQSMWNKEKLSY